MAEGDEKKPKPAVSVTWAGGGVAVGLFAGFSAKPETGLAAVQWLATEIGAVGFVAVICLGAGLFVSVAGNWLLWVRLKEKDIECQAELSRQRLSWKAVVDQKEADNRECTKTSIQMVEMMVTISERLGFQKAPTRLKR